MSIREQAHEAPSPFGDRVRMLRLAAGWTLQSLAEATGVSVSMLSQVERGQRVPTLPIAVRIADGLGTPLSELLEERAADPSSAGLVRREAHSGMVDPETGVRRVHLSRQLPAAVAEFTWYRIPPGETAGPFVHRDPGIVEQVTVISGRLEVRVGPTLEELRAGDSLGFPGTVEHAFTNRGRTECSVVHVAHPRTTR